MVKIRFFIFGISSKTEVGSAGERPTTAIIQRGRKKQKKAGKKLITISGRLLRELARKLPSPSLERYQGEIDFYKSVIARKRTDKNKIYSLHKPYTACIAKGKAHKQYEFGNKVGIMVNPKSLVILGVQSFSGNPHACVPKRHYGAQARQQNNRTSA